MYTRPVGRAVFYTHDSGGEHETTPGECVRWAQRDAARHGVRFAGTPDQIDRMIRDGVAAEGDVFVDYGVKGNRLDRPGLDTLFRCVEADPAVSHVLIPRRDRLARPDDPYDGMTLENRLRKQGVTFVYMEKVLPPLGRGHRDIGETVVGLVDFHKAGADRRELSQKILLAQLTLTRAGFTTGGRAPYGFCRWQVRADGTPVRRLADGEWSKRGGHHVVWLPVEDEAVWATIHRILDLLAGGVPASLVVTTLTADGVPPPHHGRIRTDRGVAHATSGVWHQGTVTGISRNSLPRAVVEYGRRSMGDPLRFDPTHPRELADADLRADGRPKVVVTRRSRMTRWHGLRTPWTGGPAPSGASLGPATRRATHSGAGCSTGRAGGVFIASRTAGCCGTAAGTIN
jgi:hypothetical protein